ncbi:MAG: metallophosphoesterase [Myxococcota bacterium]
MSTTRILLFTVVVPTFWFGLHLYIGRRLFDRTAVPQQLRQLGWGVLLGLATITLVTQFGARSGLEAMIGSWIDPLYWISALHMGFFCLLLATVAISEPLRWWWARRRPATHPATPTPASPDPSTSETLPSTLNPPTDPGRRTFLKGLNLGVLGMSGAMTAYGASRALRTLEVVDVTVAIDNLPQALEGFRIVQISDLHVGPTVRRPFVERVVKVANSLGGDLIAVTGDLVDGHVEQRRPDVAPLAQLKAPQGVFYVTGNHEYYWGVHPWLKEVKRLGFKALNNTHTVLNNGLVIAGVTDLKGDNFDPTHASDPHAAIAGAPADAIKVLLAHRPRSAFEATQAGFHLQLSGHTHGGQFAPWSLLVWLAQPFLAGLHQLDGMAVYVSRGTGYWGPPVRIGADPEITRLTLVSRS